MLPATKAIRASCPSGLEWLLMPVARQAIPIRCFPRRLGSRPEARRSRVLAIGATQHFVEMVDGVLAQRIEPAAFVGARGEPALHVLAGGHVFVLHFVAEGDVALAAGARFVAGVGSVIE